MLYKECENCISMDTSHGYPNCTEPKKCRRIVNGEELNIYSEDRKYRFNLTQYPPSQYKPKTIISICPWASQCSESGKHNICAIECEDDTKCPDFTKINTRCC